MTPWLHGRLPPELTTAAGGISECTTDHTALIRSGINPPTCGEGSNRLCGRVETVDGEAVEHVLKLATQLFVEGLGDLAHSSPTSDGGSGHTARMASAMACSVSRGARSYTRA